MTPKVQFVLDVHLAKLARHLRMVGIDSLWRSDFEDDELLRISESEGRVLLTRDHGLHERSKPDLAHYVKATDPELQIREIVERFELKPYIESGKGFLTRCLECNSPILPVKPHQVHDRIPGDLLLRHDEFFLCPRCERVYWKGSHWDRMKKWVRGLIEGGTA